MKNIGRLNSPDLNDTVDSEKATRLKNGGKSVGSKDGEKITAAGGEPPIQKKIPMARTKDHARMLEITQRKMTVNNDGSKDVEQGPMNLSKNAKVEMNYWVYNDEPLNVFRGDGFGPAEIIKAGGMHCRSLTSAAKR